MFYIYNFLLLFCSQLNFKTLKRESSQFIKLKEKNGNQNYEFEFLFHSFYSTQWRKQNSTVYLQASTKPQLLRKQGAVSCFCAVESADCEAFKRMLSLCGFVGSSFTLQTPDNIIPHYRKICRIKLNVCIFKL